MTSEATATGQYKDDEPGRLVLIACPAVTGELAEGATVGVDCRELEAHLHIKPDDLKVALRDAVAQLDEPGVTIVLGYGLCSNAVLGLKTEHATLVVPRVDDCIAMLLGSNEAFSREAEKERGSYYVAKAYLDECSTIVSEHDAMVAKYGQRARRAHDAAGAEALQTGRARRHRALRPASRCASASARWRGSTTSPSRRSPAPRGSSTGSWRTTGATTSSSPRPATSSRSATSGPSCSRATPARARPRRRSRPRRGARSRVNVLCIAGFLGSGQDDDPARDGPRPGRRRSEPRRHRERDRRGGHRRRLRARAGAARAASSSAAASAARCRSASSRPSSASGTPTTPTG